MLYGLQTTYAPSTNGIKECRRFECSRAGVRNAVIFVSVSGSNIVLIRYSYSHRIFDASKTIDDLRPRPRPKRAGQPAAPKETQEALWNVHGYVEAGGR